MAPAFSSTKQAGAFVLLLLVLLLLPLVMGPSLLPPREQVYTSMWWGNGAFPFIDQQIFSEKSDIDIAFIGPSHIWYGVDTRYVQQKLSEKLGRPAVVRTFCWGVDGYDAIYLVAKDLLEHRKVHLLVFYDAHEQPDPHPRMPHLFRWADNAGDIKGLSWRLRASYYFASILGMPRNLLGLIRPDLPADLTASKKPTWEARKTEDMVPRLGSLAVRVGFAESDAHENAPFEEYAPSLSPKRSEVFVYSDSTRRLFKFTDGTLPDLQLHFIRKFAALAEEHQTSLVLLHVPVYNDRRNPLIQEGSLWHDILHADLPMVGIPPANLFSDMPDSEVQKLYSDPWHFNLDGQDYFTSIITPSLLKIYADKTSH